MSAYTSQTAFTVQLNTGIDLSNAQTAQIKYISADKEEGSWTATVESPATDGIISYQIQGSDVPLAIGTWKVWSYITFTNGTIAPGCPVDLEILKEGESCG